MPTSKPEKSVAERAQTSTPAQAEESVTVKVIFTGPFQELTGRDQEMITLSAGSTLRELLLLLSERYGSDFRDYVFVSEETLSQEVLVLVDGLNAGGLKGLKTPLEGEPNTEVEVGFLGPLPVGG
jgi:molybdopterin converting factor small subunit